MRAEEILVTYLRRHMPLLQQLVSKSSSIPLQYRNEMNGASLKITPLIFCTTCIFSKLLNLKELLYVFYLYFELVRSFMTYKLVDMLLDSTYLYRTDLNMSFNIFIICMGGLIKFY